MRDRRRWFGQEEVIAMPIDPVQRVDNWNEKYNLER